MLQHWLFGDILNINKGNHSQMKVFECVKPRNNFLYFSHGISFVKNCNNVIRNVPFCNIWKVLYNFCSFCILFINWFLLFVNYFVVNVWALKQLSYFFFLIRLRVAPDEVNGFRWDRLKVRNHYLDIIDRVVFYRSV
jgi:hypothetical protein